MIRLDCLIFGYVVITVHTEELTRVASRFFKKQISLKISRDGRIIVPARKLNAVRAALEGIDYRISDVKGLRGFILSKRRRYGFIAAVLVSAFIILLSANTVWDVRIEGCESGAEDEILYALSQEGLYIGAPWWRIDRSRVELGVLSSMDGVSWINVNRRGSVAYVRVVDAELHESPAAPVGYANVVALRDCIVEEITVKRGVAAVKPGESVKAGDVLISGVIPSALGGGYCYAEGSVKARYTECVSVHIDGTVAEKEYFEEDISSVTLNFFSFPINIFKICRNSEVDCDIIEKKRTFDIFGARLPFSFDYTVTREYTVNERTLSADELVFAAGERLNEQILAETQDADIISVATDGAFDDDGYSMWSQLVVRGEVSKVLEFDFNME